MKSSLRTRVLLPSESPFELPTLQRAALRSTRMVHIVLLALLAFVMVAACAHAQNVPDVPNPTCVDTPQYKCGSGSTSSSSPTVDPIQAWKDRWAAGAEARRQRKEKRDAENKAKAEAKQRIEQQKEAVKQAEIDAELRRADAERQRVADAERQRLLADEAERLQKAFNAMKPGMVGGLKEAEGFESGLKGSTGDSLGLKELDDGRPSDIAAAKPAWEVQITDPQIAIHARRLESVVPPLPMPAREIPLNWKQIYLNDDRLMNTTDLVVAAWEATGVLGEAMSGPVDWIIIGGKAVIADENGAYLYLVKKEQDYDAALAFLKNPAQAQQFAHLVQDVRENRPLPASANPAMVQAARAITDPRLGNSSTDMAIDSMLSKDALSSMFRKAAIEVVAKKLGDKAGDLSKDADLRKAMYDSVREEREVARKMLATESTTKEQRAEWKAVIDYANQVTANIYSVENVAHAAGAYDIGEATDKLADSFLGTEAEGRKY